MSTVLFGLTLFEVNAGETALPEDVAKAQALINIAKFVTWPSTTSGVSTDAPMIFGIVGCDESFWAEVSKYVKGETVCQRRLVIKRCQSRADLDVGCLDACSLVYICKQLGETQTTHALDLVRGKGVMTIGESEDFIYRGGVMSIQVREGKLALAANQQNADTEKLVLASQMLNLCRVVRRNR